MINVNELLSGKALKKLDQIVTEKQAQERKRWDGAKALLFPADLAKVIRLILKENWKLQKFSVVSDLTYGVNITWEDGPTARAVQEKVQAFSGKSFDGMTELWTFHDYSISCSDGETRIFGIDSTVHEHREMSDWAEKDVARIFEQESGEPYSRSDTYELQGYQGGVAEYHIPLNGACIARQIFADLDFYEKARRANQLAI